MLKKATFVQDWTCGKSCTTPCLYNTETGEITFPDIDTDYKPKESIVFESENEEVELPVCPVCGDFTQKMGMRSGIGHSYDEVLLRSDPNCESHE